MCAVIPLIHSGQGWGYGV